MRRSFHFHDLSDDEFETLVGAVCLKILGTGTIVFATGPDGGRDGKFEGTAQLYPSAASPLSGKFIVQSKHTANPAASSSDSDFGRLLEGESEKVVSLLANGELDHYIVFTNRKCPANDVVKKAEALKALGLKHASIVGTEQLRLWLTTHPSIWVDLGFDRFDKAFRIQTRDLTELVAAFHARLSEGEASDSSNADFTFVPKPRKNKINKLSAAYFDEIQVRSLPYFKTIEDFLKNPRNIQYKEMYDDSADEIRRKILTATPPFASFDEALTHVIDLVTESNETLRGKRRFAAVFVHYMYYTCDIGQHADPV